MGPKVGKAANQGQHVRLGSIQGNGGEEEAIGSHQEGIEKVISLLSI